MVNRERFLGKMRMENAVNVYIYIYIFYKAFFMLMSKSKAFSDELLITTSGN